VDRLYARFRIPQVCIVADRRQVSRDEERALGKRDCLFLFREDVPQADGGGTDFSTAGPGGLTPEERYAGSSALGLVEEVLGSMASALSASPVYLECERMFRGQLFCSFLALLLRSELWRRMSSAGGAAVDAGWGQIRYEIMEHRVLRLTTRDTYLAIRTEPGGILRSVLEAVGLGSEPLLQIERRKKAAKKP
jgi:hypothetical protein